MAERTYYDILGVSRNASQEELSRAKTALAKVYHPDATAASGMDTTALMQEILEAYRILSDPKKRKKYDRKIFGDPEEPRRVFRTFTLGEEEEETESVSFALYWMTANSLQETVDEGRRIRRDAKKNSGGFARRLFGHHEKDSGESAVRVPQNSGKKTGKSMKNGRENAVENAGEVSAESSTKSIKDNERITGEDIAENGAKKIKNSRENTGENSGRSTEETRRKNRRNINRKNSKNKASGKKDGESPQDERLQVLAKTALEYMTILRRAGIPTAYWNQDAMNWMLVYWSNMEAAAAAADADKDKAKTPDDRPDLSAAQSGQPDAGQEQKIKEEEKEEKEKEEKLQRDFSVLFAKYNAYVNSMDKDKEKKELDARNKRFYHDLKKLLEYAA